LPLAEKKYFGNGWVATEDQMSLVFSPPPSFFTFNQGDRIIVRGIGEPVLVEGGTIGDIPDNYLITNNGEKTIESYSVVSPPASASATMSASAIVTYTASDTISPSAAYAYGVSVPGASVSVTRLYTYDWQTSNARSSIISSNQVTDSRYVLEFLPSSASPVSISLDGIGLLAADNDSNFSFNAKFKTSSTCSVSATLSIDDSEESFDPVENIVYAGDYSSIRSNLALLPGTDERYSVSINISVSDHGGKVFYMTLPHLINDDLYYSNPFVNQSRTVLPDFYWEIDSQQTNPSSPFHRLIDCLSVSSNEVFDEFLRIAPYETSELSILEEKAADYAKSAMVDPTIVDRKYMPWLSQFNGIGVVRNFTKQDGNSYFPSSGAETAFARWQILNGYFGIRAGTREAIVETTRQFLEFTDDGSESTRSVAVSKHYLGNEFQIRVLTLVNETPDVTESGQESQTMLDALELCRPLGYKIVHLAVDEFEFTVGDDDLGVLGNSPIGSTED
jgi:hypothetical protein